MQTSIQHHKYPPKSEQRDSELLSVVRSTASSSSPIDSPVKQFAKREQINHDQRSL